MLEDILTIAAGLPSESVKTMTQFLFRFGISTGASAVGALSIAATPPVSLVVFSYTDVN